MTMHIHIYVMRKAVGIASNVDIKIFSDMQRPHLAHRWPKIALGFNLPQLAL